MANFVDSDGKTIADTRDQLRKGVEIMEGISPGLMPEGLVEGISQIADAGPPRSAVVGSMVDGVYALAEGDGFRAKFGAEVVMAKPESGRRFAVSGYAVSVCGLTLNQATALATLLASFDGKKQKDV